jgi:tetratricopeptide (TPR) repeat protein
VASRPAPGPAEPRPDGRTLALAGLGLALLVATLIALHGHVLRWPFISDDYVFLSDTWRGSWKNLFGAFNTVQNYFRPLGREIYFFVLSLVGGNDPRVFRFFNLAVLVAMIGMVIALGWRFGGPRAGVLAGAVYTLLYPHRVEMAWVSCSQDLIATLLALVATFAHLARRHWLAAVSFFLALFAKESVAPLPLILAAWEAWPLGPGAPSRLAAGAWSAMKKTLPFWLATAAWAVVVFAVRLWRGAWAPGSSVPVADVTLRLDHFWEGLRSALLTYVYVDQPWVYLREAMGRIQVPWAAIALLAIAATVALMLTRTSGGEETSTGRGMRLGALWAIIGTLPVALVGHHFSAYYVCFSAVGFALVAGLLLMRAPRIAVVGVFALAATLNVVANAVESFRLRSNEDDLPGVSYVTIARLGYEARYLDSLHSAMKRDPPPRGAVVYLSHAPHRASFATAGDRAPRIWFQDPALELTYIGQYRPGAETRPRRFLRFHPEHRSFAPLPETLVRLTIEGEEFMARGQWAAARASFGRALEHARPGMHDLERVELANGIGVAANREGDTLTARNAWDAALSLAPDHRGALLNRAGLDASAGRFEAAKRWVERLLSKAPHDPLALLYLARLERALGHGADAQQAWARLVAADPAFADSVARTAGVP